MTFLDWIASLQLEGFVVAIAIGLLIGAERERRRRDPNVGMPGGVRTHVVTALAGAVAAQFPSVVLVASGALVIGALIAIAYWRDRSADRGLTSEVTLFSTYLLGALATQSPALAAAIGVVIALVLALRSTLHRFVRVTLRDDEALDVLLLAGAVLVVLPLVPDTAIDRFGVINPNRIWSLTLLVLMINAVGYLALRSLGPRRGLPLAGFFGGFVSSTATIGALGSRIRRDPQALRIGVAAAMLSSIATPVQLLILLALLDRELLEIWLNAALVMAIIAAMCSAVLLARSGEASDHVAESFTGRAFQPKEALIFSVVVTAVTWGAAWLGERFGAEGAMLGITLGGFADAHSAIASAGSLVVSNGLEREQAALAVLGALATNTAMKIAAATATGGGRYAARLTLPLLLMLAAATVVLLMR